MTTYHKIQTIFKRDPDNNFKTLLEWEFSLEEFKYLQNNIWQFSEKVDGTCIRIMWKENLFYKTGIYALHFAGKTDKAQIPVFLDKRLMEIFDPLNTKFKKIFEDTPVCLYGEGYGTKIQKGGGNYREDNGFVLFDIKIGHWWLQRKDVEEIAEKLGLEIAPIIGEGTLHQLVKKVQKGFNSQWGIFPAEGIVARPKIELMARNGQRIITKLKIKDFSHE